MAENLGEALLHLKTTDKGFNRGIDKANKKAKGFSGNLSQIDKNLGNIAISAAKVGTLLGGLFVATGVGIFIKQLVDAGLEAEKAETRIAAIFQTTRKEANKTFRALEKFAAPLPVTTQEIIDSFVQLSAIGADASEKTLKSLTKVSLAFNRDVDDIANALVSLELETLKRLGVQWDRTGDTATVSFKGITREVANTDMAIRETLLELFDTELPNAIEEAQDTFGAAMSVLGSVTQAYLTTGGIALKNSLKDIVQGTTDWLVENEKILKSGITQFANDLAIGIKLSVEVVGQLIQGFGGLGKTMRPVRFLFINLTELWISATDIAIGLNQALINIQRTALNMARAIDIAPGAFGPLGPLVKGLRQLTGPEGTQRAIRDLDQLEQKNKNLISQANNADAALQRAKKAFAANTLASQELGGSTESLNEILERLKAQMGEDVPEAAKAAGKATKEAGKDTEEAAKKINAANQSIASELERVNEQIIFFGKSEREIIIIEEVLNLAAGASKELAAALTDAKLQLLELTETAEFLEGLEIVDTTEWVENAEDLGESFGESLTKGMLDEIRNSLAKVLRGDLEDIFSNLARGIGEVFSQILSNQITQGFMVDGKFNLGAGLGNIKDLASKNIGRAGIGAGIGGMIGGGIPGLAGGALGGIGGGIAGSAVAGAATAALGATIGSVVPVLGTVIGAVIGGFLGKALGGLFSDRARFDVEVFNIGNEREIAENLANGVRFFVSDVIRLGLDEAFRDEQIFVKGKGGAEDIGEARIIREMVADSLNNTADRIFGIINQLPSDMASMLRDTFRSTELVFDQLIDDASLEFDEGASDIEDITKRWQQFLEADLPARFLTTIEDFFTTTIQGLGVNAEAAQSFVNDRLEEIKNTESRELRGQLGEEFLQDFNRFVQAFNFAEGNFGGVVEQSINTLNTLAEQIKGLTGEGLPTVERLRLLTQALLSTGDVTQETLDKILQLRDGMVQLAFSVTQSIASLSRTINELGGNTSGALQTSIETLTAMAESEGLSLEERQRAIELATGQINQLIQQSQQEQAEQQRRINEQARSQIQARIELLRESESVLQDQLKIIQDQKQLVEEIGRNIQDLLLGPQSIETPFQQLGRARDTIQELFSSLTGATGAERTGIGRRIQDTFNSLLDIGGRAFQQPSLGFRDVFRETVSGLEDLRDEMEPIRSVEEINAQIESIQIRIEALQQQSNDLQQAGNDINATIPPELQALRARLQEQAEMILERRLSQLAELGFNEQNLQATQLTVLEQIRDILASPDKGTGGGRAPLPTGGLISQNGNEFMGGFGSFANGGFGNFGSGRTVRLHGNEMILNQRQIGNLFDMVNKGNSGGGNTVYINIDRVDSRDRVREIEDAVDRAVNFNPKIRRSIGKVKAS